nr:heat shock protein 20 (hsp20) [Polytomella parva]|mmetsp:Transcript_20095/g.36118  ORF Transcript_20095/g.36118 Transcript_20095/m.36118 type:complete len:260 (-) Transcript_20095:725-1504(-)|eukprot:CAMPEP_0175063228 /NCGR_PEP_ID=MMETSP0052_2-20121109/14631_1 /TAXON_ID=51329 ORGANISM="Polytomella parva, Strain SAG 63-3" /NCGR_SAMPLE_ID=MMETSP0052_2 /ASSEMBLY_ACC=CAM_ASM_000194 /LENGTH=259 /DNA_ID=CAMNT_0016329385 /DNA_START=27 /DNA_END=806 /DNA_ORIENTATION=+
MSFKLVTKVCPTARVNQLRRINPFPLQPRPIFPLSSLKKTGDSSRFARLYATDSSITTKGPSPSDSSDDFFTQFEKSMERAVNKAFVAPFSFNDPFFSSPWLSPHSPKSGPGSSTSLFPVPDARFIPMDVVERDSEYELIMDTPGLRPEDVIVEVQGDFLKVRGTRKQVKEEKSRVLKCEISGYSFTRAVPLPEDAKADQVVARLEDGILHVTIPKNPNHKKKEESRRIPVGGGTSAKVITSEGGDNKAGQVKEQPTKA